MRRIALALLLVAAPISIHAQAPVPVAAPDAPRLVAARALIEAMMPAAKRDQMIRDMIGPQVAMMRGVMAETPEIQRLTRDDPRMAASMQRFIDTQSATMLELVRRSLPNLLDAMATAYARRFTVAQLGEARAFYATPTGRAFVESAAQVMSDPAVVAAQRTMMTEAMARVRESVATFAAEAQAKDGAAKGGAGKPGKTGGGT